MSASAIAPAASSSPPWSLLVLASWLTWSKTSASLGWPAACSSPDNSLRASNSPTSFFATSTQSQLAAASQCILPSLTQFLDARAGLDSARQLEQRGDASNQAAAARALNVFDGAHIVPCTCGVRVCVCVCYPNKNGQFRREGSWPLAAGPTTGVTHISAQTNKAKQPASRARSSSPSTRLIPPPWRRLRLHRRRRAGLKHLSATSGRAAPAIGRRGVPAEVRRASAKFGKATGRSPEPAGHVRRGRRSMSVPKCAGGGMRAAHISCLGDAVSRSRWVGGL